jgi:hypothetical protein
VGQGSHGLSGPVCSIFNFSTLKTAARAKNQVCSVAGLEADSIACRWFGGRKQSAKAMALSSACSSAAFRHWPSASEPQALLVTPLSAG